MTLQEKAHMITASDDCERLMSKFCYYYSAGMNREAFYRLWSKREDIAFTLDLGQIRGRHSFFKSFVLEQERRAFDHYMALAKLYPQIASVTDYRRMMGLTKPLMSNMVFELAEDGFSAKALFYTMGYEYTTLNLEQKIRGRWFLQRHGADFVFEDGKWKILNMRVCTDVDGLMDLYQWPVRQKQPDLADAPAGLTVKRVLHKKYSGSQVPQNSPAIPRPYKTYSEEDSYAAI